MHESELGALVDCIECGATISVGPDRGYVFGSDHVLCFACAERRGGRYDADRDDWSSPPDTLGLPTDVEG